MIMRMSIFKPLGWIHKEVWLEAGEISWKSWGLINMSSNQDGKNLKSKSTLYRTAEEGVFVTEAIY